MGENGYRSLLSERVRLIPLLHTRLQPFLDQNALAVLPSPANNISFAISLNQFSSSIDKDLSYLGAMLFQRNVSGCRVVVCSGKTSKISGYSFINWGAHSNSYAQSYFTIACAIGMTEKDIDLFISRLNKVFAKFSKSMNKPLETAKKEEESSTIEENSFKDENYRS